MKWADKGVWCWACKLLSKQRGVVVSGEIKWGGVERPMVVASANCGRSPQWHYTQSGSAVLVMFTAWNGQRQKLPVKTHPLRYIPPLIRKKIMYIFFSLTMILTEQNNNLEDFMTTNYRVHINHNATNNSLYDHRYPPSYHRVNISIHHNSFSSCESKITH